MNWHCVLLAPLLALTIGLAACGGAQEENPPWPTGSPQATQEAAAVPPSCSVSQAHSVTADVAPGLGESPVWVIAGPVAMGWGPETPFKTVIVVQGDFAKVELAGRRQDGDGEASFANFDDSIGLPNKVTRLVLKPGESEVSPGGRQTGPEYHYYVGYFLYPSPGCWEFTATAGGQTVKIVQYVATTSP